MNLNSHSQTTEWYIPDVDLQVRQRDIDDPLAMWGFGLFLTFAWHF